MSKDMVKSEKPATDVATFTSFADMPEHLKNESAAGINGLDSSDFKLPRIKLLQALSPEVRAYPGKAIPGHFWHSGANVSLGNDFKFVPASASKRAILWSSRNNGAKLVAFSSDGRNWSMGGNQSHELTVKGLPKPVMVNTGKDVVSSRLLEWGSSNPADPKSPPAATLIYEYLCYLPDHPEMSPCIMGMYRTAIDNAKKLNTSLLQIRKPIYSVVVDCISEEIQENGNVWSVPSFKLAGWASKEAYTISKKMSEDYEAYTAVYTSDEVTGNSSSASKSAPIKDDEIPF